MANLMWMVFRKQTYFLRGWPPDSWKGKRFRVSEAIIMFGPGWENILYIIRLFCLQQDPTKIFLLLLIFICNASWIASLNASTNWSQKSVATTPKCHFVCNSKHISSSKLKFFQPLCLKKSATLVVVISVCQKCKNFKFKGSKLTDCTYWRLRLVLRLL